MKKKFDFCCDIEANRIDDPTTIWMLAMKVVGEERWVICRSPSELRKVLPYVNRVIFHHGLGFDLPTIRRLWGIPFTVEPDTWGNEPCEHIDTFHLSSYLNPDRVGGHSLENLASGSSNEKMNFRQACIEAGVIPPDAPEGAEFLQDSDVLLEYNKQDVRALEGVYLRLLKEAEAKYGEDQR